MARFIHLARMGYIDIDDIVQVYHPSGAILDLSEPTGELAIRFATPIFDGNTETHITKLTDKDEIEYLISALGLLACPHNSSEAIAQQIEAAERRDILKKAVALMKELKELVTKPQVGMIKQRVGPLEPKPSARKPAKRPRKKGGR